MPNYFAHAGTPRHRERRIVVSEECPFSVVRTNPGGTDSWFASVQNTRYQLVEDLDDTHGHYVSDGEFGDFVGYFDNVVDHNLIKLGADYQHRVLPVVIDEPHLSQMWWATPTADGCVATPHWLEVDQLLPYPPEGLYNDLIRKAMRRFFQQIPVEVEGFNFLSDLTKLHDLIPRVAESITATIAAGFLNWNFGWAPFIGDLRAIAGIVDSVSKRLQYLRDTWGRKTRLSYSKKDFWQPPAVPFYMNTGSSPFITRAIRESYRADFQCNAWFTHHLDGLNDKLTEIRAIAIALGFGNPIKAVWEFVPFSFVLDWLSSATTVFDTLGVTSISQGDFWVYRPTYSVTIKGTLRLAQYTYWVWPLGWTPSSLVSRGSVRLSHYRRWVGIPEAPSLFDLDALSPKQASLLLAIAASGTGCNP